MIDTNKMREAVARAIWNIRREEDRCDMDLEDMGPHHSVWVEADAAIGAVVVELPEHKDDSGFQPSAWDHHDHGFNEAVDECRKAIEAQGLKVAP